MALTGREEGVPAGTPSWEGLAVNQALASRQVFITWVYGNQAVGR